jgi:hypothetical protein
VVLARIALCVLFVLRRRHRHGIVVGAAVVVVLPGQIRQRRRQVRGKRLCVAPQRRRHLVADGAETSTSRAKMAASKPAAESPPPEPWVLTQLGPAVLLEEKVACAVLRCAARCGAPLISHAGFAQGDMVRARLRWGATLSAPVASVRRELDVRVWSFVAGKQQFSTRVTLAQTVGELRARAAKHLGVEPAEARLVVRGHELTVEPDEKPLGACNVQWREPFEVLVVIDESERQPALRCGAGLVRAAAHVRASLASRRAPHRLQPAALSARVAHQR